MDNTKTCTYCKHTKHIKSFPIKEFRKDGTPKRRGKCTNCKSGSNKERVYYDNEKFDKLSKINNTLLENKLSIIKRDIKRSNIIRNCTKCSIVISKGMQVCSNCLNNNRKKANNLKREKDRLLLTDYYIKKRLRQSRLSFDEITPELINIHREQLKLKRCLKEMNSLNI